MNSTSVLLLQITSILSSHVKTQFIQRSPDLVTVRRRTNAFTSGRFLSDETLDFDHPPHSKNTYRLQKSAGRVNA